MQSNSSNTKPPLNIDQLNVELAETFAQLRDDPRRGTQAKELANLAGKIIGTMKLKLVYSALRGEEPEIPYLGKTSGRPLKNTAFLLKSQ